MKHLRSNLLTYDTDLGDDGLREASLRPNIVDSLAAAKS